ncbi:ankyrin repeat domain-containing protein [Cohnella sp. WQ 127256]|uniref:ankyrin repeat domain-containing protein n=1 Tax=Cohnella sp. WQ 127256 TaxID=2938790 RepID=UPI0021180A41|nr:ankyrin repeat domain-containing protein [Cohnella sp. WQ 127256]
MICIVIWFLTGCQQQINLAEEDISSMNTAFFQAAERGDTDEVLQEIKNGVDINTRDALGRTAIIAATHANKVDVVKALIEAGADINLQDNKLDNPFLYAGAEGLLEILKLMNDAGADPTITNRYGGTALIPASEHGYVEVVEELLTRSKVNVNHINNLGWTALMEAIVLNNGGEKQQQVIKLLIEHGADVTIPDKNGVTPLQHARSNHFTAIERLLVDAGA